MCALVWPDNLSKDNSSNDDLLNDSLSNDSLSNDMLIDFDQTKYGSLNAHIQWNDFINGTNFTIGIRKAF